VLGKKDFKEIFGAELISITGGLIAGSILAIYLDKIMIIPGILILFPAFLEMRGNISGTLSARLSSGLWLGIVKPRLKRNRTLHGNIVASFILVILVSLVLGLIAYLAGYYLFAINNPAIILIAVVAGILSNLIEIPLTIATTFWLFKNGHDPNNIMGPYITTTGDIISIVSLLITVVII